MYSLMPRAVVKSYTDAWLSPKTRARGQAGPAREPACVVGVIERPLAQPEAVAVFGVGVKPGPSPPPQSTATPPSTAQRAAMPARIAAPSVPDRAELRGPFPELGGQDGSGDNAEEAHVADRE